MVVKYSAKSETTLKPVQRANGNIIMINTLIHEPILLPGLVGPSFFEAFSRRYDPSDSIWSYSPLVSGDADNAEGFEKNFVMPEGMVINEAGTISRTIHKSRPETHRAEEYDLLLHPLHNIEETTRVAIKRIDRMMVNFYWPKPTTDENGNLRTYMPHIDYEYMFHHMYTAIINTSRVQDVGPTYFFEPSQVNGSIKLDLAHTVYLNQGDCVVFPSYFYHCAGHCDKERQNINMVFETETKIGPPSLL